MYKIKRTDLIKLAKDKENIQNLYRLYLYKFDILGISNIDIFNSKLLNLKNDIEFFDFYNNLIEPFHYYANLKSEDNMELKEKVNLSDQLTLVNDFFKSIDPEIYNTFLKHFNKHLDHLEIGKCRPFTQLGGEAYLNERTSDYYVTLRNSDYLDLARSYAHECGHIVGNILGNTDMRCYNELFIEIDSTFFELLFIDYLQNYDEFKEDSNCLKNDQLFVSSDDANLILNKQKIVNSVLKLTETNIYNTRKSLFKDIENDTNINYEDIKYYLNSPIEYTFKYLFSSTYSYELFNIYKIDKEKALYLFKQLVLNHSKNTFIKMEKLKELGISPATNIDSFTRSLKR